MFGFPRELSEFGLKEYLRLTVIVCAYILVRPLFEKFFAKLGERARLREKRQQEEKMARQFKEQRVKEKLGIETTENVVDEDETSAITSETQTRDTQAVRKSVASALRKKKPETKNEKLRKIIDDFESDEDISDLIPASTS